jgi:hypothetical protein
MDNQFKENIKSSFKRIGHNLDDLKVDHDALKISANEWIIYLERQNKELAERVKILEKRVAALDTRGITRGVSQVSLLEEN